MNWENLDHTILQIFKSHFQIMDLEKLAMKPVWKGFSKSRPSKSHWKDVKSINIMKTSQVHKKAGSLCFSNWPCIIMIKFWRLDKKCFISKSILDHQKSSKWWDFAFWSHFLSISRSNHWSIYQFSSKIIIFHQFSSIVNQFSSKIIIFSTSLA